ncbi:hypothetical protein SAICODRAFT_21469 [Saitoella complicata NRRL Y-17804]|nr:uncharacterized protein SAICODRAFT_21469 [Saitoella complicata NRRL Y-17804]ODQ50494.1 hypothetical protein SAICODRAFT_21469 [Saitoella complicata NRRL Y-17804]
MDIPQPPTIKQKRSQGVSTGSRPQRPHLQTANSSSVFLILHPLNNTFQKKTLPLPPHPQTLRIGRQTSSKTVPSESNPFFDSKVLSRSHAEIFTSQTTPFRVFIRDVRSSNGTFVNGVRLSKEGEESEPVELREGDVLELGIDILGDEGGRERVVHQKVAARVEWAGVHPPSQSGANGVRVRMEDIDPANSITGANVAVGTSFASRKAITGMSGMGSMWSKSVSIEMVVKKLNAELCASKDALAEIQATTESLATIRASIGTGSNDAGHGSAPSSDGTKYEEAVESYSQPHATAEEAHIDQEREREEAHERSELLEKALQRATEDLALTHARIRDLESTLERERLARESAESKFRSLVSELESHKLREEETKEKEREEGRRVSGLESKVEELEVLLRESRGETKEFKRRLEVSERENERLGPMVSELLAKLKEAEDKPVMATPAATSSPSGTKERLDADSVELDERDNGKEGKLKAGYAPRSNAAGPGAGTKMTELSVPFGSAIGVVLVGVGLMYWLNGWNQGRVPVGET